jgi:hypothetical protein
VVVGPRPADLESEGTLRSVLGAREAVVVEVRRYEIHGAPFVEVALAFPDRTFEKAQLGAESVPEPLAPGDQVIVRSAMNVVVALERPAG